MIKPFADGSSAVFNRVYWDSTVLQAADLALLHGLRDADGGVSEADLIRQAAVITGRVNDEAFGDYCREALRQLAHVGLIVTADES